MRCHFTYQKSLQSVEASRNTKPKCPSEKTIDITGQKKSIAGQQLIIPQGKNRLPLNSSIYNFSLC